MRSAARPSLIIFMVWSGRKLRNNHFSAKWCRDKQSLNQHHTSSQHSRYHWCRLCSFGRRLIDVKLPPPTPRPYQRLFRLSQSAIRRPPFLNNIFMLQKAILLKWRKLGCATGVNASKPRSISNSGYTYLLSYTVAIHSDHLARTDMNLVVANHVARRLSLN